MFARACFLIRNKHHSCCVCRDINTVLAPGLMSPSSGAEAELRAQNAGLRSQVKALTGLLEALRNDMRDLKKSFTRLYMDNCGNSRANTCDNT